MTSAVKKDRKSVFREVGLDTDEVNTMAPCAVEHALTNKSKAEYTARLAPLDTRSAGRDIMAEDGYGGGEALSNGKNKARDTQATCQAQHSVSTHSEASSPESLTSKTPWYAKLATGRRPRVRTGSNAPPSAFQPLSTVTMLALAVVVMAPVVGRVNRETIGIADAGVVRIRADSTTNACARWAQQGAYKYPRILLARCVFHTMWLTTSIAASVNGTLYIYGGEAKSSIDQENNTWNNDFLTLDLTSSWDTSSPSLSGLPQPSGPPAVALGYLWNDYDNLYLYGGEFADNPYVEPAQISVWKYAINSASWTEYTGLETSDGNSSDGGGVAVQRAAEGAGISVPELGLSWYFGGHLDWSTTPGWSDQIDRVYLKTLLELTHPGYTNNAVYSLANSGAPAEGVYRNITQGGLQTSDNFTERADGALIYVPGWGQSGVLIGLAGGTESSFTDDMSTLDVYDIASSQWYHQQTTGTAPGVRVNPCAVVASAPDASSFQIHLFGGQNLQPAVSLCTSHLLTNVA